jgi:hypothetical protein
VTAFPQFGLLNRIHLPSNTAELVVLANNLGTAVNDLAPIAGFGGVLLTLTPTEAYGIAFFQTGNQAAAAAALVSGWWKQHLPNHSGQVETATVLAGGASPDARMVWAPVPVGPVGPLLDSLPLPHDASNGHVDAGELDAERVVVGAGR